MSVEVLIPMVAFAAGVAGGAWGAYTFFQLGLRTQMVLKQAGVDVAPRPEDAPTAEFFDAEGKAL